MALATALPHRPQNPVYPPQRAGKTASSGRAGETLVRKCYYCGKRLKLTGRGNTCNASCRAQLSKLKRRLADTACMEAFQWQRGEGEALIRRYGLPRMETVLGWRGVVWKPERKQWVFEEAATRVA